eukprot:2878173-Prymnesium_polylepis.2
MRYSSIHSDQRRVRWRALSSERGAEAWLEIGWERGWERGSERGLRVVRSVVWERGSSLVLACPLRVADTSLGAAQVELHLRATRREVTRKEVTRKPRGRHVDATWMCTVRVGGKRRVHGA